MSVDPVTADGNTGGNFNRYWYANNNPYRFVDPDGREVVIGGDSAYKEKVVADLDQAKNAHSDLRKMVESLEGSKNLHHIVPSSDGNYNQGNGNPADERNGVGVGTTTHYDPDSETRANGEKRDPVVGLVHELTHADDKDKGKMDRTVDPSTGNKKSEDRAVEQENKMRKVTGDPPRKKYD